MANNFKPMQIKILDPKKLIIKKNLPRIKTIKKLASNNSLAEDGLFSESIFGRIGSVDRMNKMAYIDLNYKVLQPYIYLALKSASSDFEKTAMGILRWSKSNNKWVSSKEGEGKSGLKFIYDNFEELLKVFIPTASSKSREINLRLINKYPKDVIWTDKWIVIPAGLRDINTLDIESRGKSDYDPINDFYSTMINLSNQLGSISDVDASLVDEKFGYQMQIAVVSIYQSLIEKKMAKKGGLIQKSALAKTVSYSAGNVICNPKLTREAYDEKLSTNIPFGHIGISTSQLVDKFYPFVVYRLKELMDYDEKIDAILKGLTHAKETDTQDDIINHFIDFIKVDIPFMIQPMEYKNTKYSIKVDGKERVLTVLDFMKNEVVDRVIHDKFTTGTRYPCDNKLSTQYLKPVCLTTEGTELVKDDETGIEYELSTNDIVNLAYQPNSHSLKPWGGDHDALAYLRALQRF